MKPLGKILKVTRSKSFLIRLSGPIDEDLKDFKVVTDQTRFVGVIRDVIGRVESPYALVKVIIPLNEANALVGERLYTLSREEERLVRPGLNKV